MPNLENTADNKNLFQMMGCNQWSKTLTQSFVFWWSTYSIFSLVFPSLMYVHGARCEYSRWVVYGTVWRCRYLSMLTSHVINFRWIYIITPQWYTRMYVLLRINIAKVVTIKRLAKLFIQLFQVLSSSSSSISSSSTTTTTTTTATTANTTTTTTTKANTPKY